MVSEAFAGLSALKTAFDLAKGLKDIDNATSRNAVVIELQEKLLAARNAQETLLQRIGELEKEMARFETWTAEKERYQLTDVGSCTFAYALKASMRATEPAHYICANCYQKSQKSILHHMRTASMGDVLTCPQCNAKILIRHGYKAPFYAETYT